MATRFGCPNCGETRSLKEVNKSVNTSLIDYIDADTGEVHWDGETEYGDPEEHVGYFCAACDAEFDESAFDPTEREKELAALLQEMQNLDS